MSIGFPIVFLMPHRQLVLPYYLPWAPPSVSMSNYLLNFGWQLAAVAIQAQMLSLYLCYFMMFLYHIACQLDFVGLLYSELLSKPGMTKRWVDRRLQLAVELHQDVLVMVSKLSKLYSFNLLTFEVFCIMGICLSFTIMLYDPVSRHMGLSCSSLAMAYFLLSYFGNMVAEKSVTTATMAYTANWIDFDLQQKKTILFVITNAQVEKALTVGGFGNLSLERFSHVMRRSYSICIFIQFLLG